MAGLQDAGQMEPMAIGERRDNSTWRGLGLAAAIVCAWLTVHIWGIFFADLGAVGVAVAGGLILLQCWLYVGLFIVAHDSMHGSLAPGRPWLNRTIGRACLLLYAGFPYDSLREAHMRHHRFAGTADDPDFLDQPPHGVVAWYIAFFRTYFSAREWICNAVVFMAYVVLLGAPVANVLLIWVVPAVLSSAQLFFFGTYLTHRPGLDMIEDRHRARDNAFPRWLSLVTCFHFGYHHVHHDKPHVPWWGLPAARDASAKPDAPS